MKKCTWLGVMWGLCLASMMARADAPLPVVAAPVALPTGDLQVDASDAGTAAVWEAMKSGKMTPEEAWQKGLLDAQAVQAGLNQGLAGGQDQASEQLRLALGGVLVQHAPEVVADAFKQPKQVQLALADYYASIGNEKAVPLYEAVLKQTPAYYEQGLLLNAYGAFWAGQNQPQKAQEVYERGYSVLHGKTPMFAAEMLLWAGHAWLHAGDWDKANAFYQRIPAEGDSLMSSLGLHAQTSRLMGQGKHQEALVLIQANLKQAKGPMERAIDWMDIAKCHYAQGQWEAARVAAQQSLVESAKQPNPSPSIGMNAVDNTATDLIRWTQLWQQKSLICWPEEVKWPAASLQKTKQQTLQVRVTVRSFKAVPLTLSCDDTRVQCHVLTLENDPWFPNYETRFAEQVVEVEVPAKTALQTTLHITSNQLPGAKCDVPLKVSS